MHKQVEDGALQHGFPFFYRLYQPEEHGEEALVLLHGSGVDETTLVPLARKIARRALLIAVRGRIAQDGGLRWFTRITPTRFDQESIRAEAEAFGDFVSLVVERHDLDLARTAFLGYSNGANLISSVMLLRPGLIGRAALLRPMPVLDDVPPADLAEAQALVIAGAADATYGPFAPAVVDLLRRHGAEVEAQTIPSGHEFGAEDARLVRSWLARSTISNSRRG
jgi:phospholipase/carboxylesterase